MAGRKPLLPQGRADHGGLVRAQHHEPGEIAVLGAEPIGEPRSQRGPPRLDVPRVHHEQRRLVIRDVGVHRSDHADVVRAFSHVGEEFAHFEPRLSVTLEAEGRLHQRAGSPFRLDLSRRQRLAVVLLEGGFGIEGVDLRDAAVHEQEDHVLRARLEMRLRHRTARGGHQPARGFQHRGPHQAGEGHHAEAGAHGAQRVAPGPGLPVGHTAPVMTV